MMTSRLDWSMRKVSAKLDMLASRVQGQQRCSHRTAALKLVDCSVPGCPRTTCIAQRHR